MSIITFNWDKHFIYAIIYWVLEICVRLAMYLKWEDWFKMSDSDVQNEYIYVVLLTISDLLAAFLVLYIKCSFKKEQKKLNKADTEVELIYDPGANEINNNKNLIIRMIIVSASTYFSRSLYWISYGITGAKNNISSNQLQKDVVNTLDIIIRYIFSIFILHIIIHRHRVVSMFGIFVGFLFLIPADIILLNNQNSGNMRLSVGYVAILALRGLSIPFEDTFIKKYILRTMFYQKKLCFSGELL